MEAMFQYSQLCKEVLSDEDYCKLEVESYNSMDGEKSDLYDCPICRNKKFVAFISPVYHDFTLKECDCVKTRKILANIRKSGFDKELQSKTFNSYITNEPWQKNIKNLALEFLQSNGSWFYAGGQSGSGKTHICTAICNHMLGQGKAVKYILWRKLVQKLSANKFSDEYDNIISDITDYDAIYIDDFLKSSKIENELNIAFEIINSAYIKHKILIVSSELTLDRINSFDEATAGRIIERSSKFIIQIQKNPDRNFRLRNISDL